MAGHAYPHIVFAADEQALPREELETLLRDLFADADPAPEVTQGALQVELHLGDYTFTFWYDDDAEGLGERYADYAPALRRRRVTRCTTMIDLSGDTDPDEARRGAAEAITSALAQREKVYVFSEEAKRFVGMVYEEDAPAVPVDEPVPAEPTPPSTPSFEVTTSEARAFDTPPLEGVPAEPVAEPAPTPLAPAASDDEGAFPEVAAPEPTPTPTPTATPSPVTPPPAAPASVPAAGVPDLPHGPEPTVAEPPAMPTEQAVPSWWAAPVPPPADLPHRDTPAPQAPAAAATPAQQPAAATPEDGEGKPKFFKRLFGRGKDA